MNLVQYQVQNPADYKLQASRGRIMDKKSDSELVGKIVFYLTVISMLAFFWWLLIYDHGVASAH